jgi:sulfur-oxidizing protein SoxY
VLAADWNRAAFTARSLGDALRAYGTSGAAETRDILINAPEIAENGAKVDIEISSQLAETRSIALFADRNPMPLCAALDLAPGVLPWCKLQVKLAESTRLRAVVRTADGKSHVAFRDIKVTLGGCGG